MTSLTTFGRAVGAFALAASMSHGASAQSSAPAAAAAAPSPDAAEVQRLLKNNQDSQALQLIDQSLAKNPKDAAMRFRRGVALSMLDRKAEAVAVFQKLVEDHPEMPAPYNNLAVIYGSQGDYDKARAALEKAIRTNPAYATAYQNLGDVYAQLASQAYSKALQLDKTDTTVPPKLALLRELNSGTVLPAAPAPVAVAAAPVAPPKPVQVAAATPPKPVQVATAAPAPVATTRPAPTPAPAAKPTPTTAAKPAAAPSAPPAATPAPAAASSGVAEVEAAVHAWAAAWSRRDMAAYYSAYTPEFTGTTKSHRAWEEDRKARIATRKHISVEVSDLRVSVNGDKAQAHFRQSYASDALTTSGHKTLELQRTNGKWLIRQESVGG